MTDSGRTRDTYLYFAYGSDMLTKRLQASDRAPSAEFVATASLPEHRLTFDKISKGSGKCDMEYTGKPTDQVHGVIFRISKANERALDKAEGLGVGYRRSKYEFLSGGAKIPAVTYVATHKDPALAPFDWYKEHVVRGAIEHGLPPEYISVLRAIKSVPDLDRERVEREALDYLNPYHELFAEYDPVL